ncbi:MULTISPECIES: acyl-CoA synthetase [Calditerrivibrio]|uniref:acyl-CoA synthetase n=1 Tax=Calditerrivibrio TaxID=545865 RepID=UPI003C73F762
MFEIINKTIGEYLEEIASKYPDNDAVVYPLRGIRLSCKEFDALTDRLAKGLLASGLKKGDHVAIWAHNIPEWIYLLFATAKIGVVTVTVNTLYRAHELKYLLHQSDSKSLFMVKGLKTDYVETIYEILPELRSRNTHKIESENLPLLEKIYFIGENTPNGMLNYNVLFEMADSVSDEVLDNVKKSLDMHDVINMQYTSGTTGFPKGVMLSHFNVLNNAYAIACGMNFTDFCAPPTAYRMMILQDLSKYNFDHLRHSVSAGEPLNPSVYEKWLEYTGNKIYDGYGQTETVNIIATTKDMEVKPGSMGRPAFGFEVDILDDDGNPVGIGEIGHIALKVKPNKPIGFFIGYYKDEEATKNSIHGDWYYTGDKAHKDKDGYFWFVGRADDVIKTSGYRVGPFEVESALQSHPAVAENAVIGVPDELRGTIIKAFVVLAPGFEPSDMLVSELQDHVKKETAPYKYPRKIEFVKSLPKTVSGKIRRTELREMEEMKSKQMNIDEFTP